MSQSTQRRSIIKNANSVWIICMLVLMLPIIWVLCSVLLRPYVDTKWNSIVFVSEKKNSKRVTKLSISKMNLDATISEELGRAIGLIHLAGTAQPGAPGNSCILASKDFWFRKLGDLKSGDQIEVQRGGKMYRFVVTGCSLLPENDLSVISMTGGSTLTLITCENRPYFESSNKRLVVKAVLKDIQQKK